MHVYRFAIQLNSELNLTPAAKVTDFLKCVTLFFIRLEKQAAGRYELKGTKSMFSIKEKCKHDAETPAGAVLHIWPQ